MSEHRDAGNGGQGDGDLEEDDDGEVGKKPLT